MAGLARRRGIRPGIPAGRERAVGEPQEGARRSARCAREARAAHLRGAPTRRRSDHARGSGGGVRHLARARAPDRGARLPEGAAGGAYRDGTEETIARASLIERSLWPYICAIQKQFGQERSRVSAFHSLTFIFVHAQVYVFPPHGTDPSERIASRVDSVTAELSR